MRLDDPDEAERVSTAESNPSPTVFLIETRRTDSASMSQDAVQEVELSYEEIQEASGGGSDYTRCEELLKKVSEYTRSRLQSTNESTTWD